MGGYIWYRFVFSAFVRGSAVSHQKGQNTGLWVSVLWFSSVRPLRTGEALNK